MDRKNRNSVIVFILVCISVSAFGQNIRFKGGKKYKKVTFVPQDNSSYDIYRISGIFEHAKQIIYKDKNNGFLVDVPLWFKIMESNSVNTFIGTLPAIDSIENAIMINSYKKDKFENFLAFRNYIIEDTAYVKGTTPKYSKNHIFNSITKATFDDFEHSYKVNVDYFEKTYVMEYVLIETDQSFLWITFTATETTFEKNQGKFSAFLKSISIL